jgi:hypothetical protein
MSHEILQIRATMVANYVPKSKVLINLIAKCSNKGISSFICAFSVLRCGFMSCVMSAFHYSKCVVYELGMLPGFSGVCSSRMADLMVCGEG